MEENLEEFETTELEGEDLNQEPTELENQWPTAEDLKEEIDKLKKALKEKERNGEKWVQKLLAQIKDKELFEKWVTQLASNPNSLIEIYHDNPEVATKIAKVYWFDSVIDYAKDQGIDFQPKKIDIDKIREEERAKMKQELLQEKIDDFFNTSILEIESEDSQNEVTDLFNKYLEKFKPTSLDDAKDLYELASKKIVWTQKSNQITAVKNMTATSSAKTNIKKESKADKLLEESRELAKSLWIKF